MVYKLNLQNINNKFKIFTIINDKNFIFKCIKLYINIVNN